MTKVNRRESSKNLTSNEDKIAVLLAAINVLTDDNIDYRKVSKKLDTVMLEQEKKNISKLENVICKTLSELRRNAL